MLGTNQTHATNQSLMKNSPYDAVKDFAPVAGVAVIPHVLVARKDLRGRHRRRSGEARQGKAGNFTYGSTGDGSASHLAAELFKTRAGVDMLHVPFRGAAPMATELLAGRIDVSFRDPAQRHRPDRGRRVEAAGGGERAPRRAAAELATLAEQGVPGVEADAWFALFAPAKTPQPVVEKLHRAVAAGTRRRPAAQEAMERQGLTVAMKSPAELAAMIPGEVAKWAEVIRISGARVD